MLIEFFYEPLNTILQKNGTSRMLVEFMGHSSSTRIVTYRRDKKLSRKNEHDPRRKNKVSVLSNGRDEKLSLKDLNEQNLFIALTRKNKEEDPRRKNILPIL